MQGPSPQIAEGAQGKHIPGHNNFREGRSVLTADPEELGRYAGTGQSLNSTPIGMPGSKERVDFGQHIGTTLDEAGNASDTTVGIIHYSSRGIHIVPARPIQ
jgi:filamentous hemagglutinin